MTHTSNREEGRVRQKTGRLNESTAAAHGSGAGVSRQAAAQMRGASGYLCTRMVTDTQIIHEH